MRPEHRLLEGVRLPKDDPFWKRYLPPNGWNCRCTVLEIWNDEDIAKEDFGITGVDPRKRSPEELNLLPAFDGNAGILGYGRGGSGGGIKKEDVKENIKSFRVNRADLESEMTKAMARYNNQFQETNNEEFVYIQFSYKKEFSSDNQKYCWTLRDEEKNQ